LAASQGHEPEGDGPTTGHRSEYAGTMGERGGKAVSEAGEETVGLAKRPSISGHRKAANTGPSRSRVNSLVDLERIPERIVADIEEELQ